MKKTFFIYFILVIYIPVFLNAQNNPTSQDPEATKILNQLSQQIKNYSSFKLNFILQLETYNGKIKIVNQKKGKIWMKKNKYKVDFEKQQIICDGENVWSYDESTQEVQITKSDPNNKTITPQKLLGSFYDSDFNYKLNSSIKRGKINLQEIELVPIDKNKLFFKVYLYIEKINNASYSVDHIKIFEKNGNKYTYFLSKLVPNKKMKDDIFVFDKTKYPKIEIIDLR